MILFGNIRKGLETYHATPGAVLVDVREADEFASGHIPGAINVPVSLLPSRYKKQACGGFAEADGLSGEEHWGNCVLSGRNQHEPISISGKEGAARKYEAENSQGNPC